MLMLLHFRSSALTCGGKLSGAGSAAPLRVRASSEVWTEKARPGTAPSR